MFPEAQHRPPKFGEVSRCTRIARPIPRDLLQPEVGILLHRRRMKFTSVPEAPVKKDRDLQSRKCDVARRPPQPGKWEMNSVPKPATVQQRTDAALEFIILARGALHPAADGIGGLEVE